MARWERSVCALWILAFLSDPGVCVAQGDRSRLVENTESGFRLALGPSWSANEAKKKFTLAPRGAGDSPRASLEVHCFEGGSSESALREEAESLVARVRKEGRKISDPSPMYVGKESAVGWHVFFMDMDIQEGVGLVTPAGVVVILWSYTTADDCAECLVLLKTIEFLVPPGSPIFRPPEKIPNPGYVSEYLGLRWNGKKKKEQCGWAAYQFAWWYLGKAPPFTWPQGVATLWHIETPAFRKVVNDGRELPSPGALLLWNARAGRGNGHIAVVLAVNPRNHYVRVVDCNWGGDRRGQIHDVSLRRDRQIVGWLVRE